MHRCKIHAPGWSPRQSRSSSSEWPPAGFSTRTHPTSSGPRTWTPRPAPPPSAWAPSAFSRWPRMATSSRWASREHRPDNFNDFSDGYVLLSGILADEFVNPGFIPSRTEIDLRLAQPTTAGLAELYQSLHRARSAAEDAASSAPVVRHRSGHRYRDPGDALAVRVRLHHAGGRFLLRGDRQPGRE